MTYRDQLDQLSNSELLVVHNIYVEKCNYPDDAIYDNDEYFFEEYFGNDVIGAVRAVTYGNYNYSHKYVKFDGYGNLESSDSIEDFIDLDGIENDIENNYDSYSSYIDEIEEGE